MYAECNTPPDGPTALSGNFSVQSNRKDEPMPTNGPGLDSDDTASWKPTREKGDNAGVKPSRDISKKIAAEQKRTANPSR